MKVKAMISISILSLSNVSAAMDCPNYDNLIENYQISTDAKEIENYKTNGQKLLDESFQKRLELHSTLPNLTDDCKIKLKTVFATMRTREDYIAAHFYKTPQIPASSIDYKKEPPPIFNERLYPYHLTNVKEKFEFQSGDILITKGISFISSTISSITNPKSVFSHIVFVHVDPVSKKIETMESYIGHGVGLYSIEEALKNENARILVLRLRDQTLAKKAADYMYSRIKKSETDKKPIPYDYELDFKDNSKLSCEEIGYDALKTASNNNVIIPENPSTAFLKDEDFLKRIGLKSGAMMVPADMEVDSRFNIVLDFTDYKVIRDSVRKDAVSGEMFRWMNDYQYRVHKSFRSLAAAFVWSTRYIPGLWHLLAKLSGIPVDFKKDVPPAAISTLESIKSIGGQMLDHVTIADEELYRREGRWMTPLELRSALENFRLSHPANFNKLFGPTKP